MVIAFAPHLIPCHVLYVQPTAPIKETVHHEAKPSLRQLESFDSGAVKPPEVSSPTHLTSSGDFGGEDVNPSEGQKKTEGSGKSLDSSSTGRGSGGSASFNWASIKVWHTPFCLV